MVKTHTLLELAADSIEYSGRRCVEYVSNNHAPTMQAWCPGLSLNGMTVRPGPTQTIAIIATKPGSQQVRITDSSYRHVPAPLLRLFARRAQLNHYADPWHCRVSGLHCKSRAAYSNPAGTAPPC